LLGSINDPMTSLHRPGNGQRRNGETPVRKNADTGEGAGIGHSQANR